MNKRNSTLTSQISYYQQETWHSNRVYSSTNRLLPNIEKKIGPLKFKPSKKLKPLLLFLNEHHQYKLAPIYFTLTKQEPRNDQPTNHYNTILQNLKSTFIFLITKSYRFTYKVKFPFRI